eukprot:306706-Chlamydomonas_euryale.AAC.2
MAGAFWCTASAHAMRPLAGIAFYSPPHTTPHHPTPPHITEHKPQRTGTHGTASSSEGELRPTGVDV